MVDARSNESLEASGAGNRNSDFAFLVMPRHFKFLLIGLLLFSLAIVSCYFGPRYELHKFDRNAQDVLTQTGEDVFLGLRWLALGGVLFLLGVIPTVAGVKGWIEKRTARRS
jgi:hypothetical protein